jgi:hypothetical protein
MTEKRTFCKEICFYGNISSAARSNFAEQGNPVLATRIICIAIYALSGFAYEWSNNSYANDPGEELRS